MITYELAKQLKDAGFPKRNKDIEKLYMVVKGFDVINTPTLSELIKACGDKFNQLIRQSDWDNGIEFVALYGHQISGRGSTPEEAVAKLWLELNKVTKNKA